MGHGLGVASKRADDRPVVHAVAARWMDPAQQTSGLAGLSNIAFEPVLKYPADRQQDFVTQIHEVATRLATMLGTAGPDEFGAAAIRLMDYTGTTKRDLVEKRALVAGALVASIRPVVPSTFIGSGRDLAQKIGGNREGESKVDLIAALEPLVAAEYRDAALAGWSALLRCS